jgi:dephospho-CoA kinase
LRTGLTGGIACGKTTVAAILRELGCPIIDADRIAHRFLEHGGAAYHDVLREFGREVLDAEGRVNRAKLAEIVFADPAKLALLNTLVHPHVAAECRRRFAELEQEGKALAVVEAALLIEAGFDRELDRLVVCWCRPEQQIERLLARGMSRAAAGQRIAAQMPIEEKRRRAHDLIDCSGTLEETRRQTEALYAHLVELAGAS